MTYRTVHLIDVSLQQAFSAGTAMVRGTAKSYVEANVTDVCGIVHCWTGLVVLGAFYVRLVAMTGSVWFIKRSDVEQMWHGS